MTMQADPLPPQPEPVQSIDLKAKTNAIASLQTNLQAASDELAAVAADSSLAAPASLLDLPSVQAAAIARVQSVDDLEDYYARLLNYVRTVVVSPLRGALTRGEPLPFPIPSRDDARAGFDAMLAQAAQGGGG